MIKINSAYTDDHAIGKMPKITITVSEEGLIDKLTVTQFPSVKLDYLITFLTQVNASRSCR